MEGQEQVPLNNVTWSRFVRAVKNFNASEVGWKARTLAGLLILFLLAINGLNVLASYVGRDFMTAIANRDKTGFLWWAVLYVAVFGLLTVAAVLYRFCEERLGLLWREWLTRRVITLYLDHSVYYRLDEMGRIANPDQRIAEDVRAFTVTTLSFVLLMLNGSFTVVAFSGVLWTISPLLFVVAVLYATLGSYLTIVYGRPLVWLNYSQLDKEANFRADLIHVRENAESIALLRREGRIKARLFRGIDELVKNFRKIIEINRNLGFFTTGYNYLIQIIPALIVAPMFIRGEVEFGVITQSAIAFALLLGAFSLIVTQFQSISNFTAVIARLGSLWDAIEVTQAPEISGVEMHEEADGRLAFEALTLLSPHDGRVLIKDLSLEVREGTRLLITGPNERARIALFRATAGIWDTGSGKIIRPSLDGILFLPEKPYLPPGTLRQSLLRTGQEQVISDQDITAAVHTLGLDSVLHRAGGLDTEHDWDDLLSLGEQQLLAFTRIFLAKPQFAFLDRPTTALSTEQVDQLLKLLTEQGITYLTVGDGDENRASYDQLLVIDSGGGWTLRSPAESASTSR